MIEELKLIADVLKTISDGALTGVVTYMVLDFLKTPTTVSIILYGVFKIVKVINYNKDKVEVVNVNDFKNK